MTSSYLFSILTVDYLSFAMAGVGVAMIGTSLDPLREKVASKAQKAIEGLQLVLAAGASILVFSAFAKL